MNFIKGRDKYNEAQGGTFLSLSLSLSRNRKIIKAVLFLTALLSIIFCGRFDNANAINYIITPGSIFNGTIGDFESGWVKSTGAGTTVTNNSQENGCFINSGTPPYPCYKTGTGSLKMETTAGSGAVNADAAISPSADLSDAKVIGYWLYIPTIADIKSISISIRSGTTWADYYAAQVLGVGDTGSSVSLHEGWNYLETSLSSFRAYGSASWSSINRIRVAMSPVTGHAGTVYFDSLYTGITRRPKAIINFDDGWESQYSVAYNKMHEYGFKGTIYIIRDVVDTAGKVTTSELHEMYNAGWDLGTHGETVITTLTEAEQEIEIAYNRQYLLNNGFARAANHYAYPGGQYNADSFTALSNLGFLTARTTITRNQANLIDEKYLLTRGSIAGAPSPTTLADAEEYIDKAISTGNSAWLNFHILADPVDISTKWSAEDFRSLIDYIYTKVEAGLIDVVTASEWYDGLSLTGPVDFTPTSSPSTWTNTDPTITFSTTSPVGIASYSIKTDSDTYIDGVTSPYVLDISNINDGVHIVTVKATDNAGDTKEKTVNIYIDTTPPNIYGPTVIFNDNSATVSWTTDESSTSRVDYGFTDNYNSMTEDTNMVTEHHVGLTDLMPCHEYHYRVYSKDSSDNDRFSTDNTFVTEGCPAPLVTGSWRYFSGAYATSSSLGTSSTASTSQGIPSSGTMDSSIRFDATNLFPGKSITKYIWDFGDGKTDEGRIVNHKYSSPNRYTVKVTGYDKDGNEYVFEQTIDINPEVPTIKNITSTNDTDLIIEGNGFKGDTIYLSIHSTPINLTSSVDDTGYWSYTINNASETLGEGDHSVTAIDSFKLADNTELKSSATDDVKFSVTVDNGKLKVEMEKSSRYKMFIYVLIGLIVAMIAVYFVRRRKLAR